MTAKKIKLSSIKPNPDNPRIVKDDKFYKLVESIKQFGDKMFPLRPIVIDENRIILGGNMRHKALKHLKYKEVPNTWIKQADDLTEDEKKEFIIKDNVGFGAWDWDVLSNEWDANLLDSWGLDIPDFEVEELDAQEDNYEEPEQMQVDVVQGDLIEFVCDDGRIHRLICGDSTCSDTVARLMDGEKADMVFTDPPYLMNFTGGMTGNDKDGYKQGYNAKHDNIKNDKMSDEEGANFLDAINTNIQLFCIGAFYISFYRLGMDKYFASMNRTGLKCRSTIIWEKGNHTLSNSDYMSKYEPIFYGWIDEHNFYGGNNGMDIWNIDRTKKNDLHPTMKPIPLCEKGISDGSKKNDIVFDLFLGSGSTMVAAHQLKRKCYGMELDPKYCQVIIDRMQKLDSSIKVKINNKEYKQEEIFF